MSQSEGSDRGEGLTSGQRHAPRVTWTERAAMSLMDRISDGPHSEEDVRTTLRFLAAVEDVRQELVDEAPAVAARQLQDLDNALTETIKDRDCYHEWADRLAGAIARHFGEDIGEHSNVNNPWAAALGVILDAGPMAGEVSINGLTEAETAATASVSGLAVHAVLAEQVAPIAQLRCLINSVMNFRHEPAGMVRGGDYISIDLLLQATLHTAPKPAQAATAAVQPVPEALRGLSDRLWADEKVMALNAEFGLTMDQLVRLARAVAPVAVQPAPAGHWLAPLVIDKAMEDAGMREITDCPDDFADEDLRIDLRVSWSAMRAAHLAANPQAFCDTDPEAQWIAQTQHLNCPACGGSGHVDDIQTKAARDVLAERRRQIEDEGWTTSHDDDLQPAELADAAACYALWGTAYNTRGMPPPLWPWDREWWKPADARRNNVKASALLLAATQRMDRAAHLAATGDAK